MYFKPYMVLFSINVTKNLRIALQNGQISCSLNKMKLLAKKLCKHMYFLRSKFPSLV